MRLTGIPHLFGCTQTLIFESAICFLLASKPVAGFYTMWPLSFSYSWSQLLSDKNIHLGGSGHCGTNMNRAAGEVIQEAISKLLYVL